MSWLVDVDRWLAHEGKCYDYLADFIDPCFLQTIVRAKAAFYRNYGLRKIRCDYFLLDTMNLVIVWCPDGDHREMMLRYNIDSQQVLMSGCWYADTPGVSVRCDAQGLSKGLNISENVYDALQAQVAALIKNCYQELEKQQTIRKLREH